MKILNWDDVSSDRQELNVQDLGSLERSSFKISNLESTLITSTNPDMKTLVSILRTLVRPTKGTAVTVRPR